MQEGGGFFLFFPENTDVPEREGVLDVGILMSRCSNDYFNPDAMDKVSAALTCGAADKDKPAARMPPKGTTGIRCRGKEERGERKESRSRNSRAQDTWGDYSATEMPGTGRRGRLFGNRDAEHRTQHAADLDVLAANH